MDKKRRRLICVASCLFLILIWELVSVLMKAPVILPSPVEVASSVIQLFASTQFIKNVGSTVLRAVLSFFIIFIYKVFKIFFSIKTLKIE